jgi:hypothetical protein
VSVEGEMKATGGKLRAVSDARGAMSDEWKATGGDERAVSDA